MSLTTLAVDNTERASANGLNLSRGSAGRYVNYRKPDGRRYFVAVMKKGGSSGLRLGKSWALHSSGYIDNVALATTTSGSGSLSAYHNRKLP